MNPSRIAELLDPFLGPEEQRPNTQGLIGSISTYIDILLRWNARVNLTAIRNEEEIVTRHFGESLFAARHLFPPCSPMPPVVKPFDGLPSAAVGNDQRRTINEVPRVGDVGSGAGFPGIPIKLWIHEVKLTLIESNHKKATFLREIVRALTLTGVDIQNTRAESLPNISFNVVTLRAVERFVSILPAAAGLVTPQGRLALLIGQTQLPQAQSALPNLAWSATIPIPRSDSRVLAIGARR
jgi:16S rRNA (guanine527-N7)-methyltransferase